MDLLTMSKEELSRLEVMEHLQEKRMGQRTAAEVLGVSIRQVKRLLRVYRREGAAGLISQQRGKPSHHQLDGELVRAALDLLKGRYADFGPTLAHEKLVELHRIELCLGSVRKIMIEEGLWKAKKIRERRACHGELEQMDGTDHDWFEGRSERCTLLVRIDDATGILGALLFVPEESFFGYCALLRQYLAAHGRPAGLYTDKHGIFRVNIPNAGSGDNLTQFGRAMQSLEIPILCANTPQAKGRVERVNLTLQDRLVKEMRLRNISTKQHGNAYLPEFMADFNLRFAVQPRSSLDAHRPVQKRGLSDPDRSPHLCPPQGSRHRVRRGRWQHPYSLQSQLALLHRFPQADTSGRSGHCQADRSCPAQPEQGSQACSQSSLELYPACLPIGNILICTQ